MKRVLLVVCLILTPLTSGCVRLAKQGLAEMRGANARLIPASEYEPAILADFDSVQFDPVGTSLPATLVPGEVVAAYNTAYRSGAASEAFREEFPGGGATLRISTEILFLQKFGLFKDGLCISRVRMYGGSQPVLDFLVKASNESVRAGDTTELARKSGEAVLELLIERPAEVEGGFLIFD